jgi:hypothetical protein
MVCTFYLSSNPFVIGDYLHLILKLDMYKFILQSSFNNIKQNQIESNCIPLTSLIFVLITIDLYTYYIKKKLVVKR